MKPDFKRWAENIAWRAECGEGLTLNLPHDLAIALSDAYRLGEIDQREAGRAALSEDS